MASASDMKVPCLSSHEDFPSLPKSNPVYSDDDVNSIAGDDEVDVKAAELNAYFSDNACQERCVKLQAELAEMKELAAFEYHRHMSDVFWVRIPNQTFHVSVSTCTSRLCNVALINENRLMYCAELQYGDTRPFNSAADLKDELLRLSKVTGEHKFATGLQLVSTAAAEAADRKNTVVIPPGAVAPANLAFNTPVSICEGCAKAMVYHPRDATKQGDKVCPGCYTSSFMCDCQASDDDEDESTSGFYQCTGTGDAECNCKRCMVLRNHD